jgi:hypothetical protein
MILLTVRATSLVVAVASDGKVKLDVASVASAAQLVVAFGKLPVPSTAANIAHPSPECSNARMALAAGSTVTSRDESSPGV